MKNPISWHFILLQTATHNILFTVLSGFLPEEQIRQRLWWRSGGKVPWSRRLFLNVRYERPHFLALNSVSNSLSQNTVYCAWRLSSRGTNQASTKVYTQRLYTPKRNNKRCTHNHCSFWYYELVYLGSSSCQPLINDGTQKRKARLVIVIAPGNKISKISNEWHQSMFENTLMTALVTLKIMADQQSTWGTSLKGVLVVVQWMRQYTENSPGCSTAKYTNIGDRRQYTAQCWKPLLARWTITDCVDTLTGCIGTQTTVHLSRKIYLYQSLRNHQHTLSVLWFFLPQKPLNQYIFFQPCEVQQFFSFISLVNLRNTFQLIASGVNTDASTWLLLLDLFHTYSQT